MSVIPSAMSARVVAPKSQTIDLVRFACMKKEKIKSHTLCTVSCTMLMSPHLASSLLFILKRHSKHQESKEATTPTLTATTIT